MGVGADLRRINAGRVRRMEVHMEMERDMKTDMENENEKPRKEIHP